MSYRSFEEAWQDIKKLQDKDVVTLCHHHKHHIVTVDETCLRTEYPALVTKGAFKTVWKKLVKDGEFVPVEDGGYYFACACIAHLPEVEYSCKDGILRLFLRQQNTHPFCEVKEYTE
ncbi:hypothetical protein ACFLUF_00070 [Chloroflexota bacterium]